MQRMVGWPDDFTSFVGFLMTSKTEVLVNPVTSVVKNLAVYGDGK
jgi:hypothetical protein